MSAAIRIEIASEADVDRCAEVYCEAFDVKTDPLELLLYPNGCDLEKRKGSIAYYLAKTASDPAAVLLKAVVDGQIAGFSHWAKPTSAPIPVEFFGPEGPPEAMKAALDCDVMAEMKRKAFAARRQYLEGKPFWGLELIAVDPAFQRRGVASALLKYSSEQADKSGHASWLEASPTGLKVYLQRGYKILGDFTVTSLKLNQTVSVPYLMREPQAI